MLYPELQVLLFFVIPLKVKYFGIFAAALWVFSFLSMGMLGKLNYLLLYCWASFCSSGRRPGITSAPGCAGSSGRGKIGDDD